MAALLRLPLAILLAAAWTTTFQAATTARIVVPDIAGMIYPLSSASRHVQFGDPTSSFPTTYEFVAPTTDAVTCTDAQVCLELQISSAYRADPFFLHRYDANTPLVSATFDAFDAGDILPLVPGSADTDGEATTWWFQSNATTADTSTGTTTGTASTAPHPAIDLLLRLRQRSQRLSARDQLLVNVHVELVDTRTTTSAIKVYSIYGNQRLTHTTHRVDAKTIQVALSISRNENKRDVCLIDAYPQIDATTATDASSASGSSCTACGDFLDSCQDIEPCQTIVLPCLLSQFEQMTSGEGRSGSSSSPDSDAQSDSDSQSANAGDAGRDASGEMEAGAAADPDLSAWYDAFFTDIVNSSRLLADFETVGEEDSTATTSIDPSNGGIDGSSGSTGSGSAGSSQGGVDGTTQVDLLRPLATCLASLPAAVWTPIRQAIFCLAQSNCALGTVQGKDAGQEFPTVLRLTNGTQKFVLTPIAAGTDNVDLTIVSRSIDSASSADGEQKFEYSASASYLGMFLRSFVLLRAADVSVLVEPYATDPSVLQVTLTYSDALMFRSVEFFSTAGQVGMLEDLPARAMLEYPVSSSRPALDIMLRELRARVNSDDDSTGTSHSWILAQDCLTCSAQLFGCSSTAVASKSCNYNTMSSPFGQCLRKQFPTTLFKGIMQGIASSRPVATEMSRCVTAAATATTTAASPTTSPSSAMLAASSSLACFASTRCPFGPIALVQDARAIVLETTSYIQILRISSSSSSSTTSIKVMYKAGDQFTASTAPIYATMPENQIEQVIKEALVSTGIDVSVSSSGGELLPSEWTLEIIYRYVFLPGKFSVNAVVDGTSATISQFVMEGGAAQLRAVPRDRSKIFKQSEVNAGSTTGSKDLGSGDEGTSSSSTSGGSASSATSSSSTSGGSSSSDTSASSSSRVDSSSAASSASESEDTSTSPPSPPSDPFQNASFSSSMSYAGSDAGSISSSASLASEPNAGSIGPSSSSSSTGTGTDTSSTPYGPAVLSSSDTCNHCAGALARCQGNADCMSSSRNTLVPFLADAELTAIENEEDPTRLEIDLGPVFQEFGEFAPNAFSSEESWHAFSNELYCLAQGECETGYDSAAANGQYVPSFLNMGAIPVVVHVTTYADTEWNVLMNGVIFSYVPDVAVSTSITDAVVAFQSWIVAQGTEQSLEIHAVSWDQSDTSNVATFDMKIFGSYDDSSGRYTLLPPTLIPKFTAVGGTIGGDSSGSPLAEASASLWALSLWSSGKTPQFDKLLDLLGYGIAGDTATAPAPSSTVASSSKMIGANDVCRKCASILSECQNDADCLSFSTNAVVPQLRDSTLTLHTEVYMDYGAATFSADIYPILFLTGPSAYNTQAAWDLVAAELYCLAFDACDMEYKDVYAGDTYYHPNMNLDVVRSSVSVKLRTYADTKWTVTINGNSFSYEPSTPSSGLITDAATELQNWVEALNYETSFPLEVQVAGQEVNTNSGTATLSIQFFGSFDDSFYQYMMVNPALIPRFQVAGGTTGTDALALAEANITLPSLVISTNTMKPQYSKLLDMLSYGIDGGGTTSATPEPTPTSASRSMGSSDPCRDCEAAIALCRYSADCSASSQNTLVPLLGSSVMAMSSRARDEYGSARVSLNMSSILYSLASMTTDAFRSRSAWDALASELACFSTSCDLEYDDVSSPFLGYHVTTSLGLTDVAVTLSVRTYTTTTWSMLLNGESLAYDQPSSTTIEDAAIAFRDWIETQLAQSPNDLVVTKEAPTIDSTSESATFMLSFHGATSSNANLLAPPWLIPQLAVTGGYTGEGTAFPIAGASTALWDVSIVSVGQLPQFGKLLDLLEFGLEPPS